MAAVLPAYSSEPQGGPLGRAVHSHYARFAQLSSTQGATEVNARFSLAVNCQEEDELLRLNCCGVNNRRPPCPSALMDRDAEFVIEVVVVVHYIVLTLIGPY